MCIVPVNKRKSKLSKENYRPMIIFPNISRVHEDVYAIKCEIILKIFFRGIDAVFVRVTVHSTAY